MELWTPEEIWQRSLLAKVEGLIPWQVYDHLSRCGRQEVYRTCKSCGDWSTFYYRCNLKFCPLCNWRISRKREELLRLWTFQITQPKHVVITCRNFKILTRSTIRKFGRAFGRLRRTKLWKPVAGGCISTEITNEGRGWHLHAHILCDVRFLDAAELAITWGNLVRQEFGIVKVLDARRRDYCHEVTKYVVKGAQLVSWQAEEIAQFIHAIKGVRFFSTFGTLFKLRRQIQARADALKPPAAVCACGCDSFRYSTEESEIIGDCDNP